RLADDVVSTFQDFRDDPHRPVPVVLQLKDHPVPHGHGIGALDPMGAEPAPDPALVEFTRFGFYGIPTPRGFINGSLHLLFIFSLQRNNIPFASAISLPAV